MQVRECHLILYEQLIFALDVSLCFIDYYYFHCISNFTTINEHKFDDSLLNWVFPIWSSPILFIFVHSFTRVNPKPYLPFV
jgi:hypothetical protein